MRYIIPFLYGGSGRLQGQNGGKIMKKYRIRENSIADKTVKLCNKINTEPFASIILFLFTMGMAALFDVVILSACTIA